MSKTVTVTCDSPLGLVLHLYERHVPDFGEPVSIATGDPVTLRKGFNEVDAEFWGAWLKQNEDSDLVLTRTVRVD